MKICLPYSEKPMALDGAGLSPDVLPQHRGGALESSFAQALKFAHRPIMLPDDLFSLSSQPPN